MNARFRLWQPAGLLAMATAAPACPYCDSAVGRRVAAGIFNADFPATLGLTALPLALLAGVVAAIHFGGGGAS